MVIKNGNSVDPDSKLEEDAQILHERGSLYSVVLILVDVFKNKNRFYKIQLLQEKGSSSGSYWIFKSYGRIGTDRKSVNLKQYSDKHKAIKEFKKVYFNQTKNRWEDRQNFCKHPKFYYHLYSGSSDFALDFATTSFGRASNAELRRACFTLNEISVVLIKNPVNVPMLTGLCNKFYSLVPHCFGDERPLLITDQETIANKTQIIVDKSLKQM